MIINDLQRADYIVLEGQPLDIERGVTVKLDRDRQVIVCRLNSGATAIQFRKGSHQTSALHLEPDVAAALSAALSELSTHRKLESIPDASPLGKIVLDSVRA